MPKKNSYTNAAGSFNKHTLFVSWDFFNRFFYLASGVLLCMLNRKKYPICILIPIFHLHTHTHTSDWFCYPLFLPTNIFAFSACIYWLSLLFAQTRIRYAIFLYVKWLTVVSVELEYLTNFCDQFELFA